MTIGGTGQAGRARLILALEANLVGSGDQDDPASRNLFARIRVRIDGAIPGGEYVITHPYGVTPTFIADDGGRVFETEDRGLAEDHLDAVLRTGHVAPFLRWAAGAPPGYLGDGVTERAITGSPMNPVTNFFRIDGPRIGEFGGHAAIDVARSDLFTVQGRLALRQLGVGLRTAPAVPRIPPVPDELVAAYERGAGGVIVIDLHATTAPGQRIELDQPRTLFTDRGRNYTARATVPNLATPITVSNLTDTPISHDTVARLVDRVQVDRADFSPTAQTLTVSARSSDSTNPALTVAGFGALTATPTTFAATAVPEDIVVTSANGGMGSRRVALVGGALPVEVSVIADAGADQAVLAGAAVTLDGSGSRGAVTGWAWVQTAGTPVPLGGANTPQATFIAPAAAELAFTLTVQGPGGPSTKAVVVTVSAVPPPDQVQVAQAEYRTSIRQYRIEGTFQGALPNRVTVELAGAEIDEVPVEVDRTWRVRRTLLGTEAALVPTVGAQIGAHTAASPVAFAVVTIRN